MWHPFGLITLFLLPLLGACSSVSSDFPVDVTLEQFDKKTFETVRASQEWNIFRDTPFVSLDDTVLPSGVLSRCAMTASFTDALDRNLHDKCRKAILITCDDFTAITLANLMDHPHFRADQAHLFLNQGLARRYTYYPPYELYAGLFCGLQDIPSRLVKGLSRRTDRNNYATIVEFLNENNRPWMTGQWQRLSAFQHNREVRKSAEILKNIETPDHDLTTRDTLDALVERYEAFRKTTWRSEWLKAFLPAPDDPRLRRR